MKSRVAGLLLLGVAGCGGASPRSRAAPAPTMTTTASTGFGSRELALALFKGNWAQADVTLGELRPAEPFMPPPPPQLEPDYSGALGIEWQMSDAREGPGRWAGGSSDISQSFALIVRTTPPQRVALGRWHYTMCTLLHSQADMPDSGSSGVAQLLCTGNGSGLSFTLRRRQSGETVDVHVHEGSDGMDGPTYRQGIAAQVSVPKRRAIHLMKSYRGEPEATEEDRYFPLE